MKTKSPSYQTSAKTMYAAMTILAWARRCQTLLRPSKYRRHRNYREYNQVIEERLR